MFHPNENRSKSVNSVTNVYEPKEVVEEMITIKDLTSADEIE